MAGERIIHPPDEERQWNFMPHVLLPRNANPDAVTLVTVVVVTGFPGAKLPHRH